MAADVYLCDRCRAHPALDLVDGVALCGACLAPPQGGLSEEVTLVSKTWKSLFSDPKTTIAGIVAGCSVLAALPLDQPVTWILATSAFFAGLVAADRKGQEVNSDDAPRT